MITIPIVFNAATGAPPTLYDAIDSLGTFTSARNDFAQQIGFRFKTAGVGIVVTKLKIWRIAGNTGTHTVALYNDTDTTPIVSASINMAGGPDDAWMEVSITPTTLTKATYYHCAAVFSDLSDYWYGGVNGTPVNKDIHIAEIAVAAYTSVWLNSSADYSHGPVNFTFYNLPSTNSGSFVGYDYTTHGNWIGTYGSLGYAIPSGFTTETTTGTYWSLPSGVTVTFSGNSNYTWESAVTSAGTPYNANDFDSAMEYPGASPTDPRIASTWYQDWTCQLTLSSTKTISFYFLDFDTNTRSVLFSVYDADTDALLDSKTIPVQLSPRPADGYTTGMYLRYTLYGNIRLTLTYLGGNNSVMNAMFFD